MAVFAAVVMTATASPAHAVSVSYGCVAGSYKASTGRLGAGTCDGSGTTDLYVSVSDLTVVVTGPDDVAATLYCTDFAPSGAPGHWAGDCVIYSYP
jgi:hypothetical protein